METGLISVIMPVYQAESWLEDSIRSVLNQTYKKYELILVDDGSSDRSGLICDKMAELYQNIRVFHQENHGVSSARNLGLDNVAGDYILFLDCDDSIPEYTLELLAEKMSKEDVDIIYFTFCRCYLSGKRNRVVIDLQEGSFGGEEIKETFIKFFDSNIAHNIGTKLYRREVLEDVRFDENASIYEDVRFCLAAMKKAQKIYYLDKCLYNYEYKNENSLVTIYKENYYESCCKFMDELYDWGIGKTKYQEWYSKMLMFRMQAAIKNAKKNKQTFKQEFHRICNNAGIGAARNLLRANRYKGIPIKNVIQFIMIWNKNYYGVKFLWK
jgi:glycosyltransferase involved in cell wall biosynthesis